MSPRGRADRRRPGAFARRGARLVDEAARPGGRGTRIAFVHPADLAGTLIELVELARMIRDVEIRGAPGSSEAALIAVVLDRINEEERAASQAPKDGSRPLPVRRTAERPEEPNMPRDILRPR